MELGTEVSVTQTSAKPADSEVDTMAGNSTVCMCVCVCVWGGGGGGGGGLFHEYIHSNIQYTPLYMLQY